jgi:hypothetical protein
MIYEKWQCILTFIADIVGTYEDKKVIVDRMETKRRVAPPGVGGARAFFLGEHWRGVT